MILALGFISCEEEPKEPTFDKDLLIGRWELQDAWRRGKKTETLTGTFYEFKKEGTMVTNLTPSMNILEYEYTFDGKTLMQKGDTEITFDIENLNDSLFTFSMVIQNFPFKLIMNRYHPPVEAIENSPAQ